MTMSCQMTIPDNRARNADVLLRVHFGRIPGRALDSVASFAMYSDTGQPCASASFRNVSE